MTIAAAAVFVAALLAIAFVDIRERRVPNRIVLPAAAIVLALHTAGDPSVAWAAAALLTFAGLLLAALLRRGELGMGDVKLGLLLGAMLGVQVVDALGIGLVAVAIPSLVLVLRGRRTATLPLAPFLALGGLAMLPFAL